MSETELIRLCQEGDMDAFNTLVEKYQTQVINIAYGMLSDKEDACDAAQEAFVKIYKSIGSFKGKSALSTWIYRIVSNVCNDMLRKRRRNANTVSISVQDDSKDMEITDSAPTPEELLELSEQQRILRTAIAELSAEYREIITLSDIEQLRYEEISEILKCPVGTVKSRLNRARNALKKKILKNRELFL
ncbi:MAG: sigma-70 family RNA polymerase sigma factor [Oscillospiraceae bacterium]|nr:sigma-70 family RNA polymerase sigma factor [Oscillospiraceae bacterium]